MLGSLNESFFIILWYSIDLKVTQRITRKSLLRSGYACDSAGDGHKAVIMAGEREYELIDLSFVFRMTRLARI